MIIGLFKKDIDKTWCYLHSVLAEKADKVAFIWTMGYLNEDFDTLIDDAQQTSA